MTTITNFIMHNPLWIIACVWLIGGAIFTWAASRAGMDDDYDDEDAP